MKIFSKLNSEQLKQEVCNILTSLGLKYETEKNSAHKSLIIGKERRVDIAVLNDYNDVIMHIECKNQNVNGSTEDKLLRAVEEANRDKNLGTPSIIVFSGFGWNNAYLRHSLLNGAVRIEFLEEWLKTYFCYKKNNPNSLI